jgi:glycosyltransferase involved in cell wall biosynthesis
MKISIITVCFNAEATLADTLDSVAAQSHHDIEHIVVDGGSTDGTVKMLESGRGSVTKWISERDRGIYDAMNKGIAMASGDVIGFLNADDVYAHKDVLQSVAQVFGEASVDAVYADLVYVEQLNLQKVIRYWKSNAFKPGLFAKGWMPAHPTFYARRQVYERCGNFDLTFKLQADFELTMRLLEICLINAVYIPDIWVRMRVGGVSNGSFRNVIRGNLEAYRACKKHALNVTPFFMVRKVLSRIPQFFMKPAINGHE